MHPRLCIELDRQPAVPRQKPASVNRQARPSHRLEAGHRNSSVKRFSLPARSYSAGRRFCLQSGAALGTGPAGAARPSPASGPTFAPRGRALRLNGRIVSRVFFYFRPLARNVSLPRPVVRAITAQGDTHEEAHRSHRLCPHVRHGFRSKHWRAGECTDGYEQAGHEQHGQELDEPRNHRIQHHAVTPWRRQHFRRRPRSWREQHGLSDSARRGKRWREQAVSVRQCRRGPSVLKPAGLSLLGVKAHGMAP